MFAAIEAILRAIPGIIRGINLLADKLGQVTSTLATIQHNQEKIMSELDDAHAAMTSLTAAVATGTAEMVALANKIVALLGSPTGVDPAAVEALATQMQAQADALNTASAAAKAQAGV